MVYGEFIRKGEMVGKPEVFQHGNVDFDMVPVTGGELGETDRVLLNIRKGTEPLLIVAGESFEDRVLRGLGRLIVVDLAAGIRHERSLVEGERNRIPPGNIRRYENDGLYGPLIVLSTCPGYKEQDKVALKDIVAAFHSHSILPIA